ncbi:MAG: hypothetical protein ACOYKE_02825 [Ferruginibacter sp.]
MKNRLHFDRATLNFRLNNDEIILHRLLTYAKAHLHSFPMKLEEHIRNKNLVAIKGEALFMKKTAVSCGFDILTDQISELQAVERFEENEIIQLHKRMNREIAELLPLIAS